MMFVLPPPKGNSIVPTIYVAGNWPDSRDAHRRARDRSELPFFGRWFTLHAKWFWGVNDMADKIRLGLIGASVRGTWSARSHLPAVQASSAVELTAVCTTRADSAEAARQAYGARLAFDDYR